MNAKPEQTVPPRGELIRVTGLVQGVGFRPGVWRLARQCHIRGAVWNDAQGVSIEAWGSPVDLDGFAGRLGAEAPPLARIETIERSVLAGGRAPEGFRIEQSRDGRVRTGVVADAATCPACLAEVLEPSNRRHRYPFTNCTHCGPRLSIVRAIPYDRANTSMAAFAMCPACRAEYEDPADRRFHAQPNACADCGPRVWLEGTEGRPPALAGASDPIEAAARLIAQGHILAIKGIGGIHLACDAGDAGTVERLRRRKHRYHKAFALMARDCAMIRRYAAVSRQEQRLLEGQAAPIVILDVQGDPLPAALAPAQPTLGFMLPYTPLHHLLMRTLERPIVLTSGNRSDEPQCIDNEDARRRLGGIADYLLLHDREIVNRLDDSVVRFAARRSRTLRRGRGYAPAPLALPDGFESSSPVLAMGGELKNTFCLLQHGQAIVSQHMGDLEEVSTYQDYRRNLALYRRLFTHRPRILAVDLHPDYLSTRLGRELAQADGLPVAEVQHHHAHIAACMAEHGLALDTEPVLGIILDGLGLGAAGALWGGEFLLADYTTCQRVAAIQAVPMPGGAQAMREPWRNTYAHLATNLGWEQVRSRFGDLAMVRFLETKPLHILQSMLDTGLNSPPASSCGRLFDAVAAALGICPERLGYEGQAAIELEALATPVFRDEQPRAYPVERRRKAGLEVIGWAPLWRSLLADLHVGTQPAVIAARFHQGLAEAVAETARRLAAARGIETLVLSGGVFQNRLLLEAVAERIQNAGLTVLIPEQIPASDGGLSLGQAVIAAARFGAREDR